MKNHNSCTPVMCVSVKFYNRLRERVATILATLQGSCSATSFESTPASPLGGQIMGLVDAYLTTGNFEAPLAEADIIARTIFYTLLAEIDAAIKRSRRARAAAARRRALKAPLPSTPSDLSEKSEKSEISALSEISLPSENFTPPSPSPVPRSRFGLKFRPAGRPAPTRSRKKFRKR